MSLLMCLARIRSQFNEVAQRLALAQVIMVERRRAGELGQAKKWIARLSERREFGQHPLGPNADRIAFWSGQNALPDAVDMADHIHAFEHGRPVVFHKNWNGSLAHKPDHCLGIVIENNGFLHVQALERGRHSHAEAQ
jgi:hypothetical protein